MVDVTFTASPRQAKEGAGDQMKWWMSPLQLPDNSNPGWKIIQLACMCEKVCITTCPTNQYGTKTYVDGFDQGDYSFDKVYSWDSFSLPGSQFEYASFADYQAAMNLEQPMNVPLSSNGRINVGSLIGKKVQKGLVGLPSDVNAPFEPTDQEMFAKETQASIEAATRACQQTCAGARGAEQ